MDFSSQTTRGSHSPVNVHVLEDVNVRLSDTALNLLSYTV